MMQKWIHAIEDIEKKSKLRKSVSYDFRAYQSPVNTKKNHQNLIDSQSKVVKQSAYTTTSLGSDFLKAISFYNFVSIFLQLTLSGFLRVHASFVGSLVSIILSKDHLRW